MPFPTVIRRPLTFVSRFANGGVPVLSVLAFLALAGCNTLGLTDETKDGGTTLYPCPAVGVLEGTEHVTLVTGAGTDLTDIVAKAEIGKVVSNCKYNLDESTITVNLAFDGVAELGPAATSRDLTFKTFVAVTRRFNTFDKKQVYEVPVTFEAGRRQMSFVKTVDGTILPYGGSADGRMYQILIGFQLTPDQLAYNRNVTYIPIR